MKITSRNVNGIRAILNKGFLEWIRKDNPDVLCLQETKAFETQIPAELKYTLKDYTYVWHSGQTPGYAGTAIFYKDLPDVIETSSVFTDIPMFYEDGRVTQLTIGKTTILNIYFPNGGMRADGQEMLSYKLRFYDTFIAYVDALVKKGQQVIMCGDFNICHREIDIARPKENADSIGFLPIERDKISEFISHGYVDVFRYKYGDITDKYTRRSYRAGARPRNVGRRIDYFFVSNNLTDNIQNIYHQDSIQGSDHCPVSLEIVLS